MREYTGGRKSAQDSISRFHQKAYPARVIGDIIFAWYGAPEPDSEPRFFDVLTAPSYTYNHIEDGWAVHYSRVIENQLDVSHLPFVHHNTIGRGNKTLCNGPKVVWLNENTLQTSANNEVDSGQQRKRPEDSIIKSTNLTFMFPNMWLNHVTDKILIMAFFYPVAADLPIIEYRTRREALKQTAYNGNINL